jgi:hypothetical protein
MPCIMVHGSWLKYGVCARNEMRSTGKQKVRWKMNMLCDDVPREWRKKYTVVLRYLYYP